MGMREVLLGKPGGKTLWQKMRDKWQGERAGEALQAAFAKVWNPLGLRPGDLVEVGFIEARTYEVQTVLFFHTPEGEPDYVRYGMKDLERGDVVLLEVMPEGGEEAFVYSLFELVDELEMNQDLARSLDEDEVFHYRGREPGAGSARIEELDFALDFVAEAELEIFDREQRSAYRLVTYNYFFETPDGGEEFLAIEVVLKTDWVNVYRGRRVAETDVTAMGTAGTLSGPR